MAMEDEAGKDTAGHDVAWAVVVGLHAMLFATLCTIALLPSQFSRPQRVAACAVSAAALTCFLVTGSCIATRVERALAPTYARRWTIVDAPLAVLQIPPTRTARAVFTLTTHAAVLALLAAPLLLERPATTRKRRRRAWTNTR